MSSITSFGIAQSPIIACQSRVKSFFEDIEKLQKEEKWKEIIDIGLQALQDAKNDNQKNQEASISASLTSAYFYMGEYEQALVHSKRCRELSEKFSNPQLLIKSFYLESAILRTLAPKQITEKEKKWFYNEALSLAQDALKKYYWHQLNDLLLKGKIFFNLGAAHLDNPEGKIKDAELFFTKALDFFLEAGKEDEILRTRLRLVKVMLLQQKYASAEDTLIGIRAMANSQRILMHTDYLEAQFFLKVKNMEKFFLTVRTGLSRAQCLSAKEDEQRFNDLIKIAENEPEADWTEIN